MRLDWQLLNRIFDTVYTDFSAIPYYALKQDEMDKKYDGYNFSSKGNLQKLLIEPFRVLQPKSYNWLKKGIFFYAIDKSNIPVMSDITRFGIYLNDTAYYIDYTPYPYAENMDRYHDIPLEILESWLFWSRGWYCTDDSTLNIIKSNLPSLLLKPIHDVLPSIVNNEGYVLDDFCIFLEHKFNQKFICSYDSDLFSKDGCFELRCLFDTRHIMDWSDSGYQIFTSSHLDNNRNLYIVSNADVFSIKRLDNPQDAIDSYAAHIFSGADDEFDFTPYMIDF